jgi:hypothetical protein
VSGLAQKSGIRSARFNVGYGVMARDGSIRIMFFLALAACGAACQERQETRSSVPDAPSSVVEREILGSVSRGYEPVPTGAFERFFHEASGSGEAECELSSAGAG